MTISVRLVDSRYMNRQRTVNRLNRFDRIIEDWIIPLAVLGAVVTLILLYTG